MGGRRHRLQVHPPRIAAFQVRTKHARPALLRKLSDVLSNEYVCLCFAGAKPRSHTTSLYRRNEACFLPSCVWVAPVRARRNETVASGVFFAHASRRHEYFGVPNKSCCSLELPCFATRAIAHSPVRQTKYGCFAYSPASYTTRFVACFLNPPCFRVKHLLSTFTRSLVMIPTIW